MRDLVTTNDPVLLSYMLMLLQDGGIDAVIFDGNMSAVQGTLGAVTQRLAVPMDRWDNARRILLEAGLEQWMVR